MSSTTRRQKRQAQAQIPVKTDWLWSCPRGMALNDLRKRLAFQDEPSTELSISQWANDEQARADLTHALMPSVAQAQEPPRVWDALDEILRDACAGGRLIALRDIPAETPPALQMLIVIIGERRRERGGRYFKNRLGVRFALVLDDWHAPTIRTRRNHTTNYAVQFIS